MTFQLLPIAVRTKSSFPNTVCEILLCHTHTHTCAHNCTHTPAQVCIHIHTKIIHMQAHVYTHAQTNASTCAHFPLLIFQAPRQVSLFPGSPPWNLKCKSNAFHMTPLHFVFCYLNLSTLFCNWLFTCLVPLTRSLGKDSIYTVYQCSPGVCLLWPQLIQDLTQ